MSKFPICMVVYLTDNCYLKCKHCFLCQLKDLNKHTLDYDKMIETLNELKKNNVFMIAYTGGDPLLHPHIFEILQKTTDLGMLPLLGISGLRVDENIARKIYETGVRCVQIGLNGSSKELNDLYRGLNSFDEANNSIKLLQQSNLNVNISFCLDKDNYKDLDNMLKFCHENNIYKVKIEFWEDLKENNGKCIGEQEKEDIYNKCFNFMKEHDLIDWIQCPKKKSNLNTIRKNALVIMANGDVKYSEMGTKLGNINEESIVDIIEGGIKDE